MILLAPFAPLVSFASGGTPASSDIASTCASPSFVRSIPDAGAVDVPTDVVPTFVFQPGCGGPALIELYDAADTLLESGSVQVNVAVQRFPLTTALAPDTAYRLVVNVYGPIDIPFTTGAGPADGDGPPLPTLDLVADDPTWVGGTLDVPTTLTVTDVEPGSLLLIGAGDVVEVAEMPASGEYVYDSLQSTLPGVDVCESVTVIDDVGREATDRVCVAVVAPARPDGDTGADASPTGCACAETGGPGGWLALGPLGLALAARRRRQAIHEVVPVAPSRIAS
ncbi:MAG: MYXO-CTERM sorting domain-containing protein [Myxococcota bacterium]